MRLSLSSLVLVTALALASQVQAEDSETHPKTDLYPASAKTTDAADLVDDILNKAGDDVIRAGYNNFAVTTADMNQAMGALCANPSEQALGDAQMAFDAVVYSWSVIETVKLGPVMEQNRAERILFYPDKTGSGIKQLTAALTARDETALAPEHMQEKSVGVQGLTGLEYVLNGTGFEDLKSAAGSYRCHYGQAVASSLDTLANELAGAWDKEGGILNDFRHPSPANPLFQNNKQAITAVLGTLVRGLDQVRIQRIGAFYSSKDGTRLPKKAIYWRSYNTMPSIAGNIQGLADLWTVSGMKNLLKGDATAYGGNIDFNFKSAIAAATAIDLPLDEAMTDEKQRAKLDFLVLTLADLYKLLSEDVGKAIGLGAGFSFSDGD